MYMMAIKKKKKKVHTRTTQVPKQAKREERKNHTGRDAFAPQWGYTYAWHVATLQGTQCNIPSLIYNNVYESNT